MHMTGLPIMYYALFDFQYTKQMLMNEPILYKLGFEGKYFNFRVFWWWIGYAMLQCLLINYMCIVFPQNSPAENGKTFSFYASGHQVLAVCVLLANLKLLQMTSNWTGWGELLILLSMASFFVNLYVETKYDVYWAVYRIWDEYISSPVAWLGLVFVLTSIITLDTIFKTVWRALLYKFGWYQTIFVEDELALKWIKSSCEPKLAED